MAVPFGWEGWFTLGCLGVMFVVLIRDWVPADFALVATLGVLMAAQIVTTSEGLEGFSSSSVLTVAILYVVAAGINSTGALDHIFGKILGKPTSLTVAQLRLMVPIVVASAFLNNTPLCAIMIPLVQRWARRIHQPVSQLMIPLSFASILGGTITLIGTSTNLVVAGKFETQFPGQSIGLFDIGAVGVPASMTGVMYIILFAPALLPGFKELERRSRKALGLESEDASDSAALGVGASAIPQGTDFTVSCIVTPYSPAVGKAVEEAGLRGLDGLFLTSVQRGQRMHNAVGPEFVINEDDILFFTGLVDHFGEFCIKQAFELVTTDLDSDNDLDSLPDDLESGSDFLHRGEHKHDPPLEPIGWDIGNEPATVARVSAAENSLGRETEEHPQRPRIASRRRYTFRERITKAVVRSGSVLEGKTAKECRFRKRYDAAILSLYRVGEQVSIRGNLGRIQLEVGDVLLLVTGNDFDWGREEIQRDLKPLISDAVIAEQARDGSRIESAIDHLNHASQQELEREFLIPMRVNENTQLRGARSLVGQTVEGAGLRGLPGLFLVAVEHDDGAVEHVVGPEMVLAANDLLWFAGEREAVATLRRIPGLHPPDTQAQKLKVQPVQRRLVECVVSMRSHLVGKTVRESKFRTQYEAAIIAVHRQGRRVLSKIGDIELRAGDVLILDTGPNFVTRYRDNPNFLLVTEIDDSSPPHFDKFYIALISVIVMLAMYVAFSDYISLIEPAIFVSGIMLVTGILTPESARAAVSWDVIVTIAAAFGLSNALSNTGVASTIGNALVDLAELTGTGYVGVLTAVYFATFLLSMVLSNNSAAVLMFDIAITAAQNSCADGDDGQSLCVQQMIFTLMLSASSSFSTSYGYQTNMMVLNVGNYVFMDFLRFGFPMQFWQMIFSLIFIYFLEQWYLSLVFTLGAFLVVIFLRLVLSKNSNFGQRLPPWLRCRRKTADPEIEMRNEAGSSSSGASSASLGPDVGKPSNEVPAAAGPELAPATPTAANEDVEDVEVPVEPTSGSGGASFQVPGSAADAPSKTDSEAKDLEMAQV